MIKFSVQHRGVIGILGTNNVFFFCNDKQINWSIDRFLGAMISSYEILLNSYSSPLYLLAIDIKLFSGTSLEYVGALKEIILRLLVVRPINSSLKLTNICAEDYFSNPIASIRIK